MLKIWAVRGLTWLCR